MKWVSEFAKKTGFQNGQLSFDFIVSQKSHDDNGDDEEDEDSQNIRQKIFVYPLGLFN